MSKREHMRNTEYDEEDDKDGAYIFDDLENRAHQVASAIQEA